jgi:hypothetical protein
VRGIAFACAAIASAATPRLVLFDFSLPCLAAGSTGTSAAARPAATSGDGISVTLHAAGIRSLVVELAGEQAAAPELGHAAMMEAAE